MTDKENSKQSEQKTEKKVWVKSLLVGAFTAAVAGVALYNAAISMPFLSDALSNVPTSNIVPVVGLAAIGIGLFAAHKARQAFNTSAAIKRTQQPAPTKAQKSKGPGQHGGPGA